MNIESSGRIVFSVKYRHVRNVRLRVLIRDYRCRAVVDAIIFTITLLGAATSMLLFSLLLLILLLLIIIIIIIIIVYKIRKSLSCNIVPSLLIIFRRYFGDIL